MYNLNQPEKVCIRHFGIRHSGNNLGGRVNLFSFIILTCHYRNTDVCENHIMEHKYMQTSLTQALITLSSLTGLLLSFYSLQMTMLLSMHT